MIRTWNLNLFFFQFRFPFGTPRIKDDSAEGTPSISNEEHQSLPQDSFGHDRFDRTGFK